MLLRYSRSLQIKIDFSIQLLYRYTPAGYSTYSNHVVYAQITQIKAGQYIEKIIDIEVSTWKAYISTKTAWNEVLVYVSNELTDTLCMHAAQSSPSVTRCGYFNKT